MKPHEGRMHGRLGEVASSAGLGQKRRRRSQRKAFQVTYNVCKQLMKRRKLGCLVDRGANGCIIGSDMTILDHTGQFIDLTGIEDHTVRALELVHAAFVTRTHLGDAICHVYQGAYMPDGKSILSPLQLEAYGGTVTDKAKAANNGEQPYVQSYDGHRFPLSMRQGLMYLDVRPVRDSEWGMLPHIHLTSDETWKPQVFDHEVDDDWATSFDDPVEEYYRNLPYDRFGNVVDHYGDSIPITRAEIEANVTESISDELVGSIIEYNIDGDIFHRDVSSDEEDLDWGDWKNETRALYHGWNVEGRRVSKRNKGKPPPRYKETGDRQASKKMADAIAPRRVNADKDSSRIRHAIRGKPPRRKKKSQTSSSGASTTTAPTVETTGSDSEQDTSGDESDTPRTDYNNPAKSTTQNDERKIEGGPYVGKPSEINFEKLRMHFCGAPVDVIEKTFQNTTQMGRKGAVKGLKLWKRHKAPNPALNITRRNEPVATDTIYGPGCPAVDNGSTAAQFFVGRKSGFCAVEGLGKSDKRYPVALMNHIRRYGAMDQIISDNAKAQISSRVEAILNMLQIKDWTSEAHKKNMNFAERIWRDIKRKSETTLNFSNAPAFVWLLALEYVCFIQNHTAQESLDWRTPTEWLLGYTPDITALLCFHFWEPIYYAVDEASYPSNPDEALGRFVGISDVVGSTVTFKILTEDMKVISRSTVRTATKEHAYQNRRANAKAPILATKKTTANLKIGDEIEPVSEEYIPDEVDKDIKLKARKLYKDGEDNVDHIDPDNDVDKGVSEKANRDPVEAQKTFLSSAMDDAVNRGHDLPTIDIESIIGRTFITSKDEEGEQVRAQIENAEFLRERTADASERLIRFKCKVGDKRFDEIMTYNRMLQWCDQHKTADGFFIINSIIGHRKRNGAKGGWQVHVLWDSGLSTWEDISNIFRDDPVTLAMYGLKHDLLSTPGWKRCRTYAKRQKVIGRMINQVRLKNFRNRPRYKYGFQVPRNHQEAVMIDEREGNRKWQDSEDLELKQLFDYETFSDLGKGVPTPDGYKQIPCHMVYDVKWDGRHKSRFVAGGHRTDTPIESTYSAVVSLLGVRMITFLAELNNMKLWNTDIGNAYLESFTSEKVCFIAGAEFGALAGHTLIIRKAQYGLKSSGKCWHDRLHDVLRSLGFVPSKAEEDIWMRDCGDHYEYVGVYVDDLIIASKNPQRIIDELESKPHSFKLKGTGEVDFHLGCDYFREEDGTLCVGPRKYIDRLDAAYKNHFGTTPSQKVQSPLEKNDHPELDDSPLLDQDGIAKYQSLIGTLQWTISLGRFDVATAVMSMSSFRAAPREGHLERVKRICGYLSKFRNAFIRIRTEEPDYSDLPSKDYDWSRSVYGDVKERRAPDAPEPKGKYVTTTTYKDANLYHDLSTGRAVTGVLHFLNQTPIDWFTKKQETVETATYGSEFAAARTAIQQIAALRQALQYLGVPIRESSYLFGDNESVVKSGSIPHSQLSKRHHALAYHYTREAVASKMVSFHHIDGDMNPADVLSKHWGHSQVYSMLRPMLFYKGDTADLIHDDE